MEKLLELTKRIIEANPYALLSGSLAINLQGKQTRREPADIDIWHPSMRNVRFNPIEGMVYAESSDHYEEISHRRVSYKIDGVKVDVFTPLQIGVQPLYNATRVHSKGIPMVTLSEIIQFKIDHLFDESYEDEQQKHLKDVLHILNQMNKDNGN